uniref:Uncharacterized protein n=1 Tax=Triticum urartu TaxID=4572 RepID=A0A8R7TMM4_TRIUA
MLPKSCVEKTRPRHLVRLCVLQLSKCKNTSCSIPSKALNKAAHFFTFLRAMCLFPFSANRRCLTVICPLTARICVFSQK